MYLRQQNTSISKYQDFGAHITNPENVVPKSTPTTMRCSLLVSAMTVVALVVA